MNRGSSGANRLVVSAECQNFLTATGGIVYHLAGGAFDNLKILIGEVLSLDLGKFRSEFSQIN